MIISNLDSLFFQAGTGCVSNCQGCFRQFGKKEKNFKNLIKNMQKVVNHGIFNRNIMIYNIDYFSFSVEEVEEILSFNNFFEKISFHTDFKNMDDAKIRKGLYFVYQKNFNIGEIGILLHIINKKLDSSILFAYWVESFDLVIKLLHILKHKNIQIKHFIKTENLIEFDIGNNIKCKFFITEIERISLKNCFFDKKIIINDDRVFFDQDFYIGYLEVQLSGDIRIHEPPCGFGDIVISNINRGEKIIPDFQKFEHYINNLNETNIGKRQLEICKICKNNNYSYE